MLVGLIKNMPEIILETSTSSVKSKEWTLGLETMSVEVHTELLKKLQNNQIAVGIDIWWWSVKATIMYLEGGTIKYKTLEGVPHDGKTTASVISALDRIYAYITTEFEWKNIAYVWVGVPWPVIPNTDWFDQFNAPNLAIQWGNVQGSLEKNLKNTDWSVNLRILNDADAGMFWQKKLDPVNKKWLSLGLFFGTGIGGSFYKDGKIIAWADGKLSELGHILYNWEELEKVLGRKELWKRAFDTLCERKKYSKVGTDLYNKYCESDDKSWLLKDICELSNLDDEIIAIRNSIASFISTTLAGFLIEYFEKNTDLIPEEIVIGGWVAGIDDSFWVGRFRDEFKKRRADSDTLRDKDITIKKAQHEDNSLGASMYAALDGSTSTTIEKAKVWINSALKN